PLIGLGPLAIMIAALRKGAPTRPVLTGAMAGVVAGGVAAMFYAAHCTDDSPLFVAAWYSIAIGILASLGALAGRYALRW
ncbi:MAG: NrsF family protein, partial [Maritimibacter harenae]